MIVTLLYLEADQNLSMIVYSYSACIPQFQYLKRSAPSLHIIVHALIIYDNTIIMFAYSWMQRI